MEGYNLRFGLTWVDHATGERRWKKSRHFYSEVCHSRMVN
jgi:beta-glucosidase/6-phospho-beta-glucosidase/beta-galactosidase